MTALTGKCALSLYRIENGIRHLQRYNIVKEPDKKPMFESHGSFQRPVAGKASEIAANIFGLRNSHDRMLLQLPFLNRDNSTSFEFIQKGSQNARDTILEVEVNGDKNIIAETLSAGFVVSLHSDDAVEISSSNSAYNSNHTLDQSAILRDYQSDISIALLLNSLSFLSITESRPDNYFRQITRLNFNR